jgi:hypothetical protein
MAIKTIQQNRFDGGITENLRDTSGNKIYYTENVILENGLISQTANNLAVNSKANTPEFWIHKLLLHSDGALYGYGQENVTTQDTSLYIKNYGDSTNDWALATNGKIATTTSISNNPFFLSFEGDIYLTSGGGYISKYSGTTMTATWSTTSGYTMLGGLSWQGNMYGHTANKIYKVLVSAPVEMLVIPADQTIVKLLDYGNYMAIICTNKMYLWDGVTTTTFSDIVKFGSDTAKGADILNGVIYVVSSLSNRKGFTLKAYSGGIFQTVYTYNGRYNRARTKIYTSVASDMKAISGYLYFMVNGTRSDSAFSALYEMQMFRYGKSNVDEQTSLSCWKTFNSTGTSTNVITSNNNDFVIYESGLAQKFECAAVITGLEGAYTSYYYEMANTYNSTENTTSSASGIIETVVFGGNTHAEKQLKKVILSYDPLPTAGSVTIKYKKDEDTNKAASTWTTIFTDTTDYNVTHSAISIESDDSAFPTFKEIQFRIELSGNAKLNGLRFVYEEEMEKEY